MADGASNLEETLKPFYQRALEAEDRLARLEASLAASKNNSRNEELATRVQELEKENAKLTAENAKHTAENAKHQYRIIHLVRGLKEADSKIASNQGCR